MERVFAKWKDKCLFTSRSVKKYELLIIEHAFDTLGFLTKDEAEAASTSRRAVRKYAINMDCQFSCVPRSNVVVMDLIANS